MDYETIVGLEVHVHLQTKSKMFCRCSADYASTEPNSHVCPVCLGMPGVLPVINQQAIDYTMMTALALNCSISEQTRFDRKNYPYPDLMKGYQISQFDAPIGYQGWLAIEVDGQKKRVNITRVHLEEDVAKLVHRTAPDGSAYSLMDVNRSGIPMMEIVSEPDMRSPEEARQYLKTLRNILLYLGVSTANMEEGEFRCDANISIRPEDSHDTLAKVEVKNMNSFRAVYRALDYEAGRQRKEAAAGKRLIQETRGWVEEEGITVSQRSKEYAHDYRYFPEPDLPPLVISREHVEEIRRRLPELPEARRDRFITEYRLPRYDADLLTGSKSMADYYEVCLTTEDCRLLPGNKGRKEVSNWMLGEVSRLMNANNIVITDFARRVNPERLCHLLYLIDNGSVSGTAAKQVFEEMFNTGKAADVIIEQMGLAQISDSGAIEEEIIKTINDNSDAVNDYKAGKEQALKFLVGQVMKATRGRANPQLVNDVLREKLEGG